MPKTSSFQNHQTGPRVKSPQERETSEPAISAGKCRKRKNCKRNKEPKASTLAIGDGSKSSHCRHKEKRKVEVERSGGMISITIVAPV